MLPPLHMYWVRFSMRGEGWEREKYGEVPHVCGVSAFDPVDAAHLARKWLRRSEEFPEIQSITELHSVLEIPDDNRHLHGVTVWRGVWAPPINLQYGPDVEFANLTS
jgi:hypothetical protein